MNMNDNPMLKYQTSLFFDEDALIIANIIRENNARKLHKTLQQNNSIDINALGKYGMNLLLWACGHQSSECVEVLLDFGANPNVFYDDGKKKIALIAMCADGENDAIFEALLAYGADPNGKDGTTPAIFNAAYADRWDRLYALLEKGANVDIIDEVTNMPLILFCAMLSEFEHVTHLINIGADFTFKTPSNNCVALQIQENEGLLDEQNEAWRLEAKFLLEQKGIVFPITD